MSDTPTPREGETLTEAPHDSTGRGRLLLNAYGRQCWDSGYAAAKAESPAGETHAARIAPDDWQWAIDRVRNMQASAMVNANVYGTKLLKGFGYPNEIMRAAQDARALRIVLDALATSEQEKATLREALRNAVEDAEARWDMDDPSTNPGIRVWVENGRAALSPASEKEDRG